MSVSRLKVAAALLGNFELKFDGGFSIRKFIVRISWFALGKIRSFVAQTTGCTEKSTD
jgi:hypothetical protein